MRDAERVESAYRPCGPGNLAKFLVRKNENRSYFAGNSDPAPMEIGNIKLLPGLKLIQTIYRRLTKQNEKNVWAKLSVLGVDNNETWRKPAQKPGVTD